MGGRTRKAVPKAVEGSQLLAPARVHLQERGRAWERGRRRERDSCSPGETSKTTVTGGLCLLGTPESDPRHQELKAARALTRTSQESSS